jgi:hypothetical protein
MIGDVPWRGLRALRADPPQLAGKGERRKVFSAALEQAEQLFRGAASLGYASRPLNLFYGLSQAGRALSAAHDSQQSTWRLQGHGITHKNVAADFENRTLVNSGTGAFGAVATLLDSPSFDTPVELGRVLAAIPGGVRLGRTTRRACTWSRPSLTPVSSAPRTPASAGFRTIGSWAATSPTTSTSDTSSKDSPRTHLCPARNCLLRGRPPTSGPPKGGRCA